jgi:hypothetical protein
MRLRRLCLAIFAFLRFFSEPIQIFETAVPIESSNPPQRKSGHPCRGRFLSVFYPWNKSSFAFL